MSRLEKVFGFVRQKSLEGLEAGEQPGVTAENVSVGVGIHRCDASTDLNKLYKMGRVEKTGSKPVRFFVTAEETESSLCHPNGELDNCQPRTEVDHTDSAFSGIIGSQGCLKAQIELAKAAVIYPPMGLHTLICGETGVGKSMLAEAMWRYAVEVGAFNGQAKDKIPFVTFCCAEYAENPQLLLSHLFGYVRGAFTGAEAEHKGLVDRAQGGILFLDEIHRLPPIGQELLFMLVDKGCYRRLGETRGERQSHLMLICATSEDVTSSLLSTFRRRIPVTITLPRLNERPVRERIALIAHFVEQEARRLNLPIGISGQALKIFAAYNCAANIGELRNDLQLCCAKSYLSYQASSTDKIVIDMNVISQRIFSMAREECITETAAQRLFDEGLFIKPGSQPMMETISHDYELPVDLYGFVDRKIDQYLQSKMPTAEAELRVGIELEKYFNTAVEAFFKPNISDLPTSIINSDAWDAANYLLNEASSMLKRKFGRKTLVALALHMQQFKERATSGRLIYNPHLRKIEAEHALAYKLVNNCAQALSKKLGVSVPRDEIGFIVMFLAQNFEGSVKERIGLIVVAHGRATAQNMAEVANSLLGTSHIKAFDIPLHKSNVETIQELQQMIQNVDEGKGVILLVDMGFLVTMDNTLGRDLNIPIKIIPNVTTSLVLEAGRRVLTTEDNLEQAVENIYDIYREYVVTLMQRQYPKATCDNATILTVCATGVGTAEKIKELIINCVPEAALMNIIPVGVMDDVEQLANQLTSDLILIIGSINPEVGSVPFVHVSELFEVAGVAHIRSIVIRSINKTHLLNAHDYSVNEIFGLIFGQLSKFVKNLPVNNVARCCETLVDSISRLYTTENVSRDVLVRIYLHAACMFDRVSTGETLKMPDWGAQIQQDRCNEYQELKNIVTNVSKILNIKVPDSEICYFLITLPERSELLQA
jgi:Transcriptional antiterminator